MTLAGQLRHATPCHNNNNTDIKYLITCIAVKQPNNKPQSQHPNIAKHCHANIQIQLSQHSHEHLAAVGFALSVARLVAAPQALAKLHLRGCAWELVGIVRPSGVKQTRKGQVHCLQDTT